MPKTAKLNRDLQNLVGEITEDLQQAADKTGDEATKAMRRSAKAMQKAARRLGDELKDVGEDAVDGARAHPLATAAIIASAAALIGLAISRSQSAQD